jgi:hypothetical protein
VSGIGGGVWNRGWCLESGVVSGIGGGVWNRGWPGSLEEPAVEMSLVQGSDFVASSRLRLNFCRTAFNTKWTVLEPFDYYYALYTARCRSVYTERDVMVFGYTHPRPRPRRRLALPLVPSLVIAAVTQLWRRRCRTSLYDDCLRITLHRRVLGLLLHNCFVGAAKRFRGIDSAKTLPRLCLIGWKGI